MMPSPADGMLEFTSEDENAVISDYSSISSNPDGSGDHSKLLPTNNINRDISQTGDIDDDCCEDESCRVCWSIDSNVSLYKCSPLNAAEVRWFRRDSVASTSKWIPFNGFDSRRLECAFRRMNSTVTGQNQFLHDLKCPLCTDNPYTKSPNSSMCGKKQCNSKSNLKKSYIEDCIFLECSADSEHTRLHNNDDGDSKPVPGDADHSVTTPPPPPSPYSHTLNLANRNCEYEGDDEYDNVPHASDMESPAVIVQSKPSTNILKLKVNIPSSGHRNEKSNGPVLSSKSSNTETSSTHRIVNGTSDTEDVKGSHTEWVVSVSGGIYNVDLNTRLYSPIYWTEEDQSCSVIRGTWFLEPAWQPIEEEFAYVIENEHMKLFGPTSHPSTTTLGSSPTTAAAVSASSSTSEYVDLIGESIVESQACNPPLAHSTPSLGNSSANQPIVAKTTPPSGSQSPPYTVNYVCDSAYVSIANGAGSPRPTSPLSQSPRPTSPSTTVIHNVSFRDFHIDWINEEEVYLHYETASSKLYRVVGSKLGLSKVGTRLQRGYKELACTDDRPCDVTHLIFVVHGIGQMMAANDIIKSCSELKIASTKMQEKFYPNIENDHKRIEFLPVEWRSSLKLDGGLVDSVTPVQLKGLRQMLNISALDILYYSSPLHRSEMIRGLRTELNRLYVKFCKMQPNFVKNEGKVSIVAHSLGCVIMYDILTQWNPLNIYDQCMTNLISESVMKGDSDEELIVELETAKIRIAEIERKLKAKGKQRNSTLKLNFEIDKFFCLGSPLSVFLALRKSPVDSVSDAVKPMMPTDLKCRILNIYHPSDPISYRLEPLILNHYVKIKPLTIHQYDSKTKCSYDTMTSETCPFAVISTSNSGTNQTEEKNLISPSASTHMSSPPPDAEPSSSASWSSIFSWSRIISPPPETAEPVFPDQDIIDLTKDGADNWINFEQKSDVELIDLTSQPDETLEIKENCELPFRLDYALRDSGTIGQAYLAALTAHIRYWADLDVALFILMQCLGDKYPPQT